MNDDTLLTQKLAAILPHLHEKQRRLLLAAEAWALGHGGIAQVARASGVSRATMHAALHEPEQSGSAVARVRQPGGGRQKTCGRDPILVANSS
jgi:DNA-binding phage protein